MKKNIYISISTLLIVVSLFFPVKDVRAEVSIIKPFGGKVITWLPSAPGCIAFTTAVSLATFGTINPTVEELVVAPPNGGTFGILRVNLLPVPPTKIYSYNQYQLPGTNVLGSSINVCDACEALDKLPFLKDICKTGVLKSIIGTICDFVGGACPVTNLIYKMGTAIKPSL
ncbi:MAG: hypothetical protein AB1333_00965 [Patescibacteria group bacterium]